MNHIDGLFARSEPVLPELLSNPDRAAEFLDGLAQKIREEADLTSGPLVYRLNGPEPAKATPMQYGGLYLERERELLAFLKGGRELWLHVDCGPGAYLDFVSDLPADVFAWDAEATGFTLAEMRSLRQGPLCTNEPGAEFDLSRVAEGPQEKRIAV